MAQGASDQHGSCNMFGGVVQVLSPECPTPSFTTANEFTLDAVIQGFLVLVVCKAEKWPSFCLGSLSVGG